MSHEWTHEKPLRRRGHGGDEPVEQGESFEPTDAELSAFGDRIEEVVGEDDDPECADENCSRGVDEEGEYCWQHSDDDEDDTDEE
jgi:hypothetical protein